MRFIRQLFNSVKKTSFDKQVENILGLKPTNIALYTAALSHRSVKESPDENNERLEYLGDAVLSGIVADYLFKRYPYKGEGFLTEMRSKMVNRQQLNDIAVKMGLKKITLYNKIDNSLRNSQIFGNTLEAIVGAVYLDKGYKKTQQWVLKQIVIPHMFVDDLESMNKGMFAISPTANPIFSKSSSVSNPNLNLCPSSSASLAIILFPN